MLKRRTIMFLAMVIGMAGPAASIPPAPPPPGPFQNSAIAARYNAWHDRYERSVAEASDRLADARNAISEARQKGSEITPEERLAARRYAEAQGQSLERLRDLMRLRNSVAQTASHADLKTLDDALNWNLMTVYGTAPNTLEILEAVSS